jgi:hypothetical protein
MEGGKVRLKRGRVEESREVSLNKRLEGMRVLKMNAGLSQWEAVVGNLGGRVVNSIEKNEVVAVAGRKRWEQFGVEGPVNIIVVNEYIKKLAAIGEVVQEVE